MPRLQNIEIYPEKASPLDFKDTTTPRFGHGNVVSDLFLEYTIIIPTIEKTGRKPSCIRAGVKLANIVGPT